MASKDILFHVYTCAIITGTIIGANVGAYKFMGPKYETIDFVIGAVRGAVLGAMTGAISPVIAASTIVCLPSYIIKKNQSNE